MLVGDIEFYMRCKKPRVNLIFPKLRLYINVTIDVIALQAATRGHRKAVLFDCGAVGSRGCFYFKQGDCTMLTFLYL